MTHERNRRGMALTTMLLAAMLLAVPSESFARSKRGDHEDSNRRHARQEVAVDHHGTHVDCNHYAFGPRAHKRARTNRHAHRQFHRDHERHFARHERQAEQRHASRYRNHWRHRTAYYRGNHRAHGRHEAAAHGRHAARSNREVAEAGHYCKPCNASFRSRDQLKSHVHGHHRVPLWRLPFVITQAGLHFIFYG